MAAETAGGTGRSSAATADSGSKGMLCTGGTSCTFDKNVRQRFLVPLYCCALNSKFDSCSYKTLYVSYTVLITSDKPIVGNNFLVHNNLFFQLACCNYGNLQIYSTRSQVPNIIVSESFIRGNKVQLSRKTFNMYVYYILSRHQPTTIPTSTTRRTILFL